MTHPLDNVIWFALTTRQRHLGLITSDAARFAPDVSILAGFAEPDRGIPALAGLVEPGERIGLFVVGHHPDMRTPGFAVVSVAPLVQMVRELDAPIADRTAHVVTLGAADRSDVHALADIARPGPFNARTPDMGEFVGIRRDHALIAMAGQRLRVPGYTELSAICTHPDHTGRGHAAALIAALVERVVAAGERPFLHVRGDNARAIALYERLGFTRRREDHYVVVERAAPGAA